MRTLIERKADDAGPCSTVPVNALYCEPWHGHWSVAPAAPTVHPMCVQMAVCATTVPVLGRASATGPLGPFTISDPPVGTELRAASTVPDGADDVGVTVVETSGVGDGLAVLVAAGVDAAVVAVVGFVGAAGAVVGVGAAAGALLDGSAAPGEEGPVSTVAGAELTAAGASE
jgi:hypothetical protein